MKTDKSWGDAMIPQGTPEAIGNDALLVHNWHAVQIRLHNAHPVACIVPSSRKWLVTGMAASEISDRTSHNKSARLGSAGLEHITWRASPMSSSQVALVAPLAAIIRLAVQRRPARRGWL
jgi:hypothetical protein